MKFHEAKGIVAPGSRSIPTDQDTAKAYISKIDPIVNSFIEHIEKSISKKFSPTQKENIKQFLYAQDGYEEDLLQIQSDITAALDSTNPEDVEKAILALKRQAELVSRFYNEMATLGASVLNPGLISLEATEISDKDFKGKSHTPVKEKEFGASTLLTNERDNPTTLKIRTLNKQYSNIVIKVGEVEYSTLLPVEMAIAISSKSHSITDLYELVKDAPNGIKEIIQKVAIEDAETKQIECHRLLNEVKSLGNTTKFTTDSALDPKMKALVERQKTLIAEAMAKKPPERNEALNALYRWLNQTKEAFEADKAWKKLQDKVTELEATPEISRKIDEIKDEMNKIYIREGLLAEVTGGRAKWSGSPQKERIDKLVGAALIKQEAFTAAKQGAEKQAARTKHTARQEQVTALIQLLKDVVSTGNTKVIAQSALNDPSLELTSVLDSKMMEYYEDKLEKIARAAHNTATTTSLETLKTKIEELKTNLTTNHEWEALQNTVEKLASKEWALSRGINKKVKEIRRLMELVPIDERANISSGTSTAQQAVRDELGEHRTIFHTTKEAKSLERFKAEVERLRKEGDPGSSSTNTQGQS